MDTSIEMQVMEERVKDLELSLAAKRKLIVVLESENARLRAEVERLNYECNDLSDRLEHLVSVMGVFDDHIALKERIAELESENARLRAERDSAIKELSEVGRKWGESIAVEDRLRAEVERLGSDIDDVSCYAEKISDWWMLQYRGMLDKINELEELVQEHQTYTPKQSIKEYD